MSLYVVIIDKCQNDADRHAQSSLIANVKESIERTQNLTGFGFFLPSPFVKKSLGRSFRLIGYRFPIADDELILFLRVLARGSNDYEHFLANWETDTENVASQLQPYDAAQLRKIHAQLTSKPAVAPPPEPNAGERAWLYEVFREATADDELQVLETEAWVTKMRASENRDFLALYHQMLEQVDLNSLQPATSNLEPSVQWDSNRRLGVVYLFRPDLHRLLLLEPVRQTDNVEAVLGEHRARLSRSGEGQVELSRIAARAYPFVMVLDQNAWLAIQKDEEANLALSPEEAGLLESIQRAGVEGELGYPLFINGRAGSGKSTMLQYLAADYVDFALRKNAEPLPIYMTCSRDLLARARETVRGLLLAHHERLLEGALDTGEVDVLLDRCFVVFHDFLYSLLPSNLQEELPPDRYVSYAEFRRLWAGDYARRAEARHVSPDVAWHTIRSYIKGIRSSRSDELGPEEFNALPRRRRSISETTYKTVYDRVWCSWYKRLCEEQKYWDDQDLAAYVLELGLARRIDRSAVFCDEAQDFTPAELDIIFQLSVFGRRSLQPEELRRVPIVFAGDPLQTINPTGFRWDAVQADFHERFCAVLDPRRRSRVDVSYRELCFNYRSNPGIVGFCNLIQLVRAALSGARGISPQAVWWVDPPVQTVWFALDNAQTKQELQKRPELVKLVNCEEGEETEFVRADPILKTLKEEAEGIFRNVLGPTRAKGLEFPSVVLYRFGESAPRDFARLLAGEVDLQDQEKRLPYEYFFNRLYVAASRAKGQLVVVDSARALETFWRFATEPEVIDRLMDQAGGREMWKDAVTFLVAGREEAWSGERIDPREQAIEYATQGRRKRDPYLLRQATLAYRSAGDEHEAGRCLAFAAELEGKRQEAGDKYREIGLFEDAFRCYWIGRNWDPLCELTSQEPSLTSRLESRAADFMKRGMGPDEAFLTSLLDAAEQNDWLTETSRDTTWLEVLGRMADQLTRKTADAKTPWVRVFALFRRLKDGGAPIEDSHFATLAYAAGVFDVAVNVWERAGSIEKEEYRRAKAGLTPFPENLIWLARLKEHSEIVRQCRHHWGQTLSVVVSSLDDRVFLVITEAALAHGDLSLCLHLTRSRPDPEGIAKLLLAAAKKDNVDIVLSTAVIATRQFVGTRSWKAAIKAAEDADFSELPGVQRGEVRSVLGKSSKPNEVFRILVEELAVSRDLASSTSEQQTPVVEFLNKHFIGKRAFQGPSRGIPSEVVGAAIERAGKIVDALQFYETLQRHGATEKDRQFATERLAHNLEKHALYFDGRGDADQARERRKRAEEIRFSAGLRDQELPEYPVLGSHVSAARQTEWVRGPLKIVLSEAHGRLRIEHTERFETVTVDGVNHTLLGDADSSKLEPSSEDAIVWSIIGWNTTVTIIDAGTKRRIVIETLDQRIPIEMDTSRANSNRQ